MRIVGVDFGDARVGIAVSDENGRVSSAICTIKVNGIEDAAKKAAEKCAELGGACFVVGLPKNMDGSEGYRAERTRRFAELLKAESGLEVAFFDERLSTVMAHGFLNESGVNSKKRKAVIDALSAQIILMDYLDMINRRAENKNDAK